MQTLVALLADNVTAKRHVNLFDLPFILIVIILVVQFEATIGTDSLNGLLRLCARALPVRWMDSLCSLLFVSMVTPLSFFRQGGWLTDRLLDAMFDLLVDGSFHVASRTGASAVLSIVGRVVRDDAQRRRQRLPTSTRSICC